MFSTNFLFNTIIFYKDNTNDNLQISLLIENQDKFFLTVFNQCFEYFNAPTRKN